jgi:2-polyprenyl-6-methoxyphenol hydroxylase-like FAD-dependent oxidoreductase
VKLLTVALDRLERWYRPGFLCIGDAAHAMSPIGGVGINLAIQDAVAAANILAGPLASGAPSVEVLRRVQRRRYWPTMMTQRLQRFLQDNIVAPVLSGETAIRPPLALRLLAHSAYLRRLPARIIGIGFRPEHIR